MSLWPYKIGSAAVGWTTLTLLAVAQSGAGYQDVPSGDVWITSSGPAFIPPGDARRTASAQPQASLGDVWLAPDDGTGTAQAAIPPQKDPPETDA
jgi:hypothetical protein